MFIKRLYDKNSNYCIADKKKVMFTLTSVLWMNQYQRPGSGPGVFRGSDPDPGLFFFS